MGSAPPSRSKARASPARAARTSSFACLRSCSTFMKRSPSVRAARRPRLRARSRDRYCQSRHREVGSALPADRVRPHARADRTTIQPMRAIVIESKGGPDVLELREDEPEPTPNDDELLVAVEAIGVNYRDVYEREGRGAAYGRAKVPLIVGAEGAGTVLKGAGEFDEGDRVGWAAAPASYAERVAVPVANAIPLPDGAPFDLAAAVLLQGMTAHYLAYSTYEVQPGDDVLIHAAAGGVGLLLTQLATRIGARVIATTSTEEKGELARQAGAEHTLRYEGFKDQVLELTDGKGVHVVYDSVGATTFEDGIDALRPRGYMVLYGMSSGPAPA